MPFLCWPELLARSSFNITQPHKFIEFDYDAMGNRVAKHTYASDFGLVKSTYYVLDAQGNTISTYAHTLNQNSVSFNLQEHVLYGSSSLGMKNSNLSMLTPLSVDPSRDSVLVGTKSYELSNHLGNVLTVFRDVLNGDAVSGYSVPVASIADYSPFGVQLDGRTQSAGDYRYGFQGQEKDDEVKGEGNSVNYKYRMHDPRVGRFFAVDPLAGEYAYNSPYAFSENRVINARELEGMEADDCFNFGKKRGFWGKMSSKVSFPSIELTFNKVVIEKISSTTSQNFGASGRNDRSMTKNVELKGSGNIRFNAYSFEDGLQITDENGNTVFNQNVIGGVVNVPVGAGNYQIGVTGHTDPNDPSGSVWDLSIQDNSVEVVKKTKFKFLGINLMSKVEKQTVDPGNAANNGPRTVKRKILGVTFNKSESARNISMRSPANVPGRTRRKEKEKQLPKPKRL